MSYNYITQLVGEKDNIKIGQDFTTVVPGILPKYFNKEKDQIEFRSFIKKI